VITESGAVIRSASQVRKGERVRTRLTDGEFGSTVDDVGENAKSAE
jgi:exonuclease VII large subunit